MHIQKAPKFKVFLISHLSKPALHLSETTHECSSSLTHPTLKLIVANPGYAGIATMRGTASGLVFGTDFNFGYLLTGTNQMNCRSSLAESNSTLSYKYTYFICSLIYTSDDCILNLKGGSRWSIPNNQRIDGTTITNSMVT